MVDNSYKYVWGIDHTEFPYTWQQTSCDFLGSHKESLCVRNLQMEYLLETQKFIKLIPCFKRDIHIVQLNKIPPYYLSFNTLKGKSRYDILLKETDYLFEINLPSSPDYTEIVSPNREYLEKLINSL